jgi:hypothetical protein
LERNLPPAAEHYITIKGNKQRQEGASSKAGTAAWHSKGDGAESRLLRFLYPQQLRGVGSRVAQTEQASEVAKTQASAQQLLEGMAQEKRQPREGKVSMT